MAIITLTGPTCAGKTSVEAEMQLMGCGRAISHTTRKPRNGEFNGQHYHFVTESKYDEMQDDGKFIETVAFGGSRYALSATALLAAQAASENVVIVAEPCGASQIHTYCKVMKLSSFAVWIDCAPKIQAERWLVRMMGDLHSGKDGVIDPYSDRLATMLTDEAVWRERHWQGRPIHTDPLNFCFYNLSLRSDSGTPSELAAAILAAV